MNGWSIAAVTLAACSLAAGVHVVSAASLGVSSQRLTSHSFASTVPTTECTVTAAADAHVDESLPDTNDGSATSLRVRSFDTQRNARLLVHFDLSSCAIPAGASVQAATLDLYLSAAPASSRDHDAYRVTDAWSESTVTWNSQPTLAGSATDGAATGTVAGATVSWDLTADVTAFVAGSATNHGWLVRDRVEDAAAEQLAQFSAREHATSGQRPTLIVRYYP